jgi:Amt family ammonium transporter
MVFMDASATIATGTLAERWKFIAFVLYCAFVSTLVYPIFGNWVWGGGWLAKLGFVDFAGSSVVHMTGGTLALVGAIRLGPRLGKYNADGTVNVLPAHSVPMYVLGTFVLAFGWFGFNAGSTGGTDPNISRIAVNTMLASGAGAAAAMICMWRVGGRPDPSFLCNGMLAGLVAITASSAFVPPWAAILIGAVSGVLVIVSCLFWEKTAKIDDPVGAISVHGVGGLWGILALGLFADGTATWAPSGQTTPITGLLFGNGAQLGVQLVGVAANVVWVLIAGGIMFWIIEKVVGNRVSPEVEIQGLDVPEMGVLGYIDEDPTVPEGHLMTGGQEPRAARVPPDGHKRFTIVVEGLPAERITALWSELCKPTAPHSTEFRTLYRQFTLLEGTRFRFIGGDPEKVRELLASVLRAADGGKANVRTEIEPAAERTPLWS